MFIELSFEMLVYDLCKINHIWDEEKLSSTPEVSRHEIKSINILKGPDIPRWKGKKCEALNIKAEYLNLIQNRVEKEGVTIYQPKHGLQGGSGGFIWKILRVVLATGCCLAG